MKPPYLRNIRWRRDVEPQKGYPFSLPLFADSKFELEFLKPVTVIVGENGAGKSTLLEAIASNIGFAPQGGSRNHQYAAQERNPAAQLSETLRFSWSQRVTKGFFFRAESFFNFSSYLDEKAEEWGKGVAYAPYGGRSLNEQSHGEAFLSFFANRPLQPSIYILDEPEAALSPQRQLVLMEAIYTLAFQGNAQIIVATHSPLLSAMPFAELLLIENGAFVERSYEATEHYKIYKRFIEAPETLFQHMFSDE